MEKLHITITNRIQIHYPIPDAIRLQYKAFEQAVKADNAIDNPAYAEAVKHGRSTFGIRPRIILCQFDQAANALTLPRGYAGRLLWLLKRHGIEAQVEDVRRELPMVLYRSKIQLRPYQVPAVEALLRATQGILEAPAGSGKTEMGLEIVAKIGQPALWLAHTLDLAEQVMARAEASLGIPRSEIGLIGNGVCRVGERLTIGIIQTLARMVNLPTATNETRLCDIASLFGLVLLDECHHSASTSWSTVIDQLPARWRYGVTATKDRADGLTILIDRFIGPTLAKIDRSVVEASGGTIVPELRTVKTETRSPAYERHEQRLKKYKQQCEEYKLRDIQEPRKPMLRYNDVLDDILNDQQRNELIIQTLIQECPGHRSLVLSERVDHCETLSEMLTVPGLRDAVVHGKLPKRKRDGIIQAMTNGNLDILFAVDLAKEGLDIPRLDRLFLVAGGRNESELEQKVGRIQRAFAGKRDAIVWDFVDEAVGVLRAQYWARRKVYKRLGMLESGSGEARAAG